MSGSLEATLFRRENATLIQLSGAIDEDNALQELVPRIQGRTAIINMSEVEHINDGGVRDWVKWLAVLDRAGVSVVLVECSPATIAKINMVDNFTGTGVVQSFYVPYYCARCETEKVLLCDVDEMRAAPTRAPTCRCDECDQVMEFDELADSYFRFLSDPSKLATTDLALVLQGIDPSPKERSRVRTRIPTRRPHSRAAPSIPSAPSLPSVPSLPSMRRGGDRTTAPGDPVATPVDVRHRAPTVEQSDVEPDEPAPIPAAERTPAGLWIALLIVAGLACAVGLYLAS